MNGSNIRNVCSVQSRTPLNDHLNSRLLERMCKLHMNENCEKNQ